MTPSPDMLKRKKWKREYQEVANREGPQELLLEMAVEIKATSDRLTVNEQADKKHRKTPVHKAHPWTKETYIRLGLIMAALGALSGTGAGMAFPG